jgi:hypothetical protein
MAQSSITINPPLRDISGRFVKANKALLESKRKIVRVLGKRWVEIAREEAPEGKTGKFRKSIAFRTFVKGKTTGFTSSSMQPLGKWIIGGTRPHIIRPRYKNALYFFWGKVGMFTVVPKAGGFKTHVSGGKFWIGKGYVNHPGTKPNDYVDRAYDRWIDKTGYEVDKLADRFVISITGGSR